MEDDHDVMLGIPANDVPVDETCPFTAKLGGIPAWYDAENSISQEQLVCPKCQNHLYLVAQVYAPVTIPRTLYIFGCNSSKCGDTPKSWRVFRFQKEEEVKAAPVHDMPPPPAPAAAGWGDDDDDDDDWGDDDSGWGTKTESNDIEQLLAARNDAMHTKAVVQPKIVTQVETAAKPVSQAKLPHFESIYLSVEDEPTASGYDKYLHETNLLNAYLAEEEKENASEAARLRQILKNKSDVGGDAQGGGGEHAESYERTPLREKYFLKFQKRIKRSPNQCLRYNYGGEPLWPSPPPKLEIPKCTCGEERTFEMQLMPTTNYFLQVEKYVKNPIDLAKLSLEDGQQKTPAVLDGGMDWQTVVVWSCPASCDLSHEEYIFVMPPLVD